MRFTAASAALLGAALLSLSACDKGTDLNVDLPSTTSINTTFRDTPLEAATVRFDSLETLKADHFLAGRLADNVAGTTTATALLNLVPSTVRDSLPARFVLPELDSVFFTQGYDGVQGQTSVPAVFDLVALAAPLSETGTYNSGVRPVLGQPLATGLSDRLDRRLRVKAKPEDSLYIFVNDNVLRLTLYNRRTGSAAGLPFCNRLFAALKANAAFGKTELDAVVGGLALQPGSGYNKAIVNFTRNGNSRLVLYFHDRGAVAPARPAAWHSYSIFYGPAPGGSGGGSARDPRYYTYFESDFSASPLAPLADPTRSVPAAGLNGLAYLQDGVGLGVRVSIPAALVTELSTEKLAINRAELYVPVKPFSNAVYPFANGLFALEVDANNQVLQRLNGLNLNDRVVQKDGANPLGANNEALAVLYDANTSAPYYLLPVTSYLQYYLNNLRTRAEAVPAALVLVPTIRRSPNLTLGRSAVEVSGPRGGPRLRVYYAQLR